MISNLRTARQENGGFTLVELLIVIVVLGVLAGITVFGVASFKESAEAQAAASNEKIVEIAVAAYIAAEDSAGTTDDAMNALTTEDLVAAGYLNEVPDPDVEFVVTDGKVVATSVVAGGDDD